MRVLNIFRYAAAKWEKRARNGEIQSIHSGGELGYQGANILAD